MSALKDKKTGLWYYVYKTRSPITGKISWKKKRGFATKREAQHAEADAQRLKHDTVGELTFKDISHQWEDYRQSSKASRRQHTEHFTKRFSKLYELSLSRKSKERL
ncbi:Arm DNA-binding domain-containing protein [Solobacterium moorei]